MTITYVSSLKDIYSGTFTTSALNTTGANFLAILISRATGTNQPVVTDNKGNTWTLVTSQSGDGVVVEMFYAANATTGTGHTFTFTGSDINSLISVLSFAGVKTTSPLDQSNWGANGVTYYVYMGSITPTENNEVCIGNGAPGDVEGSTPTVSDGAYVIAQQALYNYLGWGFPGMTAAYKILVGGGNQNPWVEWTNNVGAMGLHVSFKEEPAAVAGHPSIRRFGGFENIRRRPIPTMGVW